MWDSLGYLLLFAAKALIIVALVLFLLMMILVLVSKAREKNGGHLLVRNLSEKLRETKEALLGEIQTKSEFKKGLKEQKKKLKALGKNPPPKPRVFVLTFQGDLRASAVASLREEITAVLTVATPKDEIVLKLESPGGMVHTYGLAAAELERIRKRKIPLTVVVDTMAASGGYLMACVGNKILAAPFAIIGSIGVIFQLPNFHRVLDEKHVDFEQITVGNYKRTLTMFGKNTEEGRNKLRDELEDIHQKFKDLIVEYRKDLDINTVATGEHWLAKRALELKLIDGLMTSDDYLMEKNEKADVYEIVFEIKQSLGSRLKMAYEHFSAPQGLGPLLK